MARIRIGSKIREHRKNLGITQAALAERCGISASYLNLIESDRRNIGGALLKRVADALELPIERFDGAAERRLLHELAEIAADPLLASPALAATSAADLVAQHAPWAHAIVKLHRACSERNEVVAALSDRYARDPFLGETVQEMSAHIASIRLAVDQLGRLAGPAPALREDVIADIADDSRRLAAVTQTLAGYLAKTPSAPRPLTPIEELEDFVVSHDNHFPQFERVAESLQSEIGLRSGHLESALVDHLEEVHRVQVRSSPLPGGAGASPRRRVSHFDRQTRVFELLELAPEASRRFELARLAAELGAGEAIAAEIAASPVLTSAASRQRAARALSSYTASALLLPYAEFLAAAQATRYDIDLLARRFNASFEQVCHRLVSLRRPGAAGVRFGYMRSDPAGHVTKRFPLPGLPLPRYGTGCPLWAVYRAFQTPGALLRQLVEMPGGERFLLLARAVEKERSAFGMPQHFMSIMLVCDARHAAALVYGEGIDLSAQARATPVGQTCRVCVRSDCAYRQADPVVGAPTTALAGSSMS
ncbi:helix-turn-helix domain-containing protein [Rhodocyclus tenuis]|uniref:HTH cro/C1-type domain-containing protein n=1 Tax=Rhodocyclus tenuis TaxID=1066 RepID=A0A840GBS0_RHOTE|nr:helix-turn-helix transcriptional regulator [Rhodocyclus tenuis]MBB4246052.1 hypothetical protein [Rhodocyclus tenuis]